MWEKLSDALSKNQSVSMQTEWVQEIVKCSLNGAMSRRVFMAGASSKDASSAFWVGYQMAIQKLFSPLLNNEIAAFVVNENKSSKPADWATTLEWKNEQWHLSGRKDFVTASDQIDALLVTANLGNAEENSLGTCRVCKLPIYAENVVLDDLKLPVLSGLKKSRASFSCVEVLNKNVSKDDGYIEYVKPFRLIEDFYVSISLLGFLTRLILKSEIKGVATSEFLEEVSLCYEAMLSCEERVNLSLTENSVTPDFTVESFIKKVGQLIVSVLKEEGLLGSYQALKSDLMILKIGQKARDIRYQRAFEGITRN